MKNIKKLEINQSQVSRYIHHALLLVWIIFAIIKYNINPFFFGLSIGVSVFIILTYSTKKLVLTNDYIFIEEKRIIQLFNTKVKIIIDNIEEIKYKKETWSLSRLILSLVRPGHLQGSFGNKPNYLSYKLINEDWIEMVAFGLPEENEKLISLIEQIRRDKS